MLTVKEISAEFTYELRHKTLHPNQPEKACQYPGDDLDTTFHLGAFENRKLTGVASFYMEGTDAIHSHKQFRMRGMAVDEPDQDLRIGTTLLHKANRILYNGNAEYLWCIAKTSAQPFYERIGFAQIGNAFETEKNEAHVILYKKTEIP